MPFHKLKGAPQFHHTTIPLVLYKFNCLDAAKTTEKDFTLQKLQSFAGKLVINFFLLLIAKS